MAPARTDQPAKADKSTKTKTEKTSNTTEPSTPNKTSSNAQSIIIAILVTVIVCAVIALVALIGAGVIKFGESAANRPSFDPPSDTPTSNTNDSTPEPSDTSSIITNPNSRVQVKDATFAKVGDLEFYLPDDFEAGGKNGDGAYTYNLVDDDGWAQVLVYMEKSSLTPQQYLNKISSYLDITNANYQMNGTTWVQGENANALAYATKLDDTIYAVYYSVKLDSDDTAEAMSMIPKTLYMDKIYK